MARDSDTCYLPPNNDEMWRCPIGFLGCNSCAVRMCVQAINKSAALRGHFPLWVAGHSHWEIGTRIVCKFEQKLGASLTSVAHNDSVFGHHIQATAGSRQTIEGR